MAIKKMPVKKTIAKTRVRALVDNVNRLALTWRQRLKLKDNLQPGSIIKVASDCTGYGSELIALMLLGLRDRVQVVMSSDNDASKVTLPAAVARACGFKLNGKHYADILARKDAAAPEADVYVAGYPCPSFSVMGKRLGTEDRRGFVTLKGLQYIATKRPRVVILEQVESLTHKKHSKVWTFMQKILRLLDYDVEFGVLSPRDFAIPQSRRRLYVCAVTKESRIGDLKLPSPRETASDLHFFLEKDNIGSEVLKLPHYERLLGKKMWAKGYILDVDASESFQTVMTNVSPCLTRTRLKNRGFYIPKLQRRLLPSEAARLQGVPQPVWRAMQAAAREEGLSENIAAAALGDAMALNCLMLCLRRALDASSLATLGSAKDYWAQVPAGAKAAQMSDRLFHIKSRR